MIQLEQIPIDRRIGQEILRLLPPGWGGGTLTATRSEQGPSSESYRIAMVSRPRAPGVAIVSDELQDAIRDLFLLHKRHKTRMRVARYLVDRGNGSPKMVAEFEYED